MTPTRNTRFLGNTNNLSMYNTAQVTIPPIDAPAWSIQPTQSAAPIDAPAWSIQPTQSTPPIDAPIWSIQPNQSAPPIDTSIWSAQPNQQSVPPIEAPVVPTQCGQPIFNALVSSPPGIQEPLPGFPEDGLLDNISLHSTLPAVVDFEMGLAPLPVTSWVTAEHFASEIFVDKEVPPFIPGDPSTFVIQTEIVKGKLVLIKEPRPTLGLADKDAHSDWLLRCTGEFLLDVRYYLGLGKVVDLFYAQEARLGYPEKVGKLFFRHVCILTTSFTTVYSSRSTG